MELTQYNHVIHTTSMSYIWDNVYAYDKEFRYRIARHPTRSWSVILQQAWTMLIKDRVRQSWISTGVVSHTVVVKYARDLTKGSVVLGLVADTIIDVQ